MFIIDKFKKFEQYENKLNKAKNAAFYFFDMMDMRIIRAREMVCYSVGSELTYRLSIMFHI